MDCCNGSSRRPGLNSFITVTAGAAVAQARRLNSKSVKVVTRERSTVLHSASRHETPGIHTRATRKSMQSFRDPTLMRVVDKSTMQAPFCSEARGPRACAWRPLLSICRGLRREIHGIGAFHWRIEQRLDGGTFGGLVLAAPTVTPGSIRTRFLCGLVGMKPTFGWSVVTA
jgi:hypothetical protein